MSPPTIRRPHLLLSYEESVPEDVLRSFIDEASDDRLDLQVERREAAGPQAGIEWLLPTAVVLYVTKPYFDGFLQEAGKEHYHALKRGVASLWATFFGKDRKVRAVVLASSPAKVSQEPRYSWTLSLMAEVGERRAFKLLLSDAATREELELSVGKFLEFLIAYHHESVAEEIASQIREARPVGGVILMAYNADRRALEVVDPRSRA